MSTEIELKLQLSPKAARQLAGHPLLADLPSQRQRLLNTYFDTPELELHARRMAVRFRKKGGQWLCTVKTAEPASGGLAMRNEWETPATPGIFDFSHVDAAELRDYLEHHRPRLGAVFTTDFNRQTWQIPFGQSLIELAIDRGHVESCGRRRPICEIELELLSGAVDDIFGLTRQLQHDIDLYPAITSKAERGYNLFLDAPLAPFKARPATVNAGQTLVEAFRSIALDCLEHFQRNEPGLINGGNTEFVHQARVALRRLRSAIKLFAPALPSEFVATYGQAWKMLASTLGEARNWDVFLEETLPPIAAAFPADRDVKRLRKAAQKRARNARQSIAALLAVREYPRLLLEFTAALYTLSDTQSIALSKFAHRQIARCARKANKLAASHSQHGPAERHRLRIAFKKLRYTLEFFAPLLPPKRLKRQLAKLSQLQDELGQINDLATAEMFVTDVLHGRNIGLVHGWVAGRIQMLVSRIEDILRNSALKTKPGQLPRLLI